MAMKSKINTSCENVYYFGDSVWFKLESSKQWKSGVVLGMDGKVLFVKYGNFIRRVPIDHVVPADKHYETPDNEVDEDDIKNTHRLKDDDFTEVDALVKKDREIHELKKINEEKDRRIEMLEKSEKTNHQVTLPKLFQKICFRQAGSEDTDVEFGKVVRKQKIYFQEYYWN